MDTSLRREPSLLWIGLIAPVVQAIAAFAFEASPELQGILNAAAVAVAGAVTAFLVRADNLVPALTGAAQAMIAVLVAFGLGWTGEQQAALMVPLGIVASIIVRDRVVAPSSASTPV